MDDIDRALTRLFVLIVIVVAIVGVWAIGMYMSTKTYHGCTVTGTDPNGEFGGHFYEVSCGNGVTFSNVAGGVRYACARIGDIVTVETYGQWCPTQITGDSSC